ncbi:MAG: hypothetical protein GF330_10000 [Candidatus Eisenbacteria bacterium]|nr:hypothetical protein [Candidatus Eisenbacteria bacterium]
MGGLVWGAQPLRSDRREHRKRVGFSYALGSLRSVVLAAGPNPVVLGSSSHAGIAGGQGAVCIRFALPHSQEATLRLYDSAGRLVRTLLRERLQPGTHDVTWDGRDARGRGVSAGSYYYQLTTGAEAVTGRLAIVR